MADFDLTLAHRHCINNKPELSESGKCGCFYCMRIFDPAEIKEWIPDTAGTAMCPYCGIDSVIGDKSGYPVTEEFLKAMNDRWFGDV